MANINTAINLWRKGKHRDALAEARAALADAPDSTDLLNMLATMHVALNQPGVAAEHLRRVIGLEPNNAVAHSNLGVLLEQMGDSNGAASSYRAVLAIDGTNAVTHFNLGNVLLQSGRPDEALACYQRAVSLRPDFAAAWCNCAGTLLGLKQAAEALACSDKAVALNAAFPEAWFTRGVALKELERSEEALKCCERAMALRKDYAEAIYVRANILRGMGDSRSAVAGFRQALRLNPAIEEARISAVVAEIPTMPATVDEIAASRRAFEVALADLETDLQRRPCADPTALVGAMQPFYLAYQDEDNRELLGAHGRLCATLMGNWQHSVELIPPGGRAGHSKLRIGFVSAHIASHPVYTAMTRGWLRRLDRRRFAVDVFHLGIKTDAETAAARSIVDHFEEGQRPVREWAKAIIDARPDVLVYPEVGMDQTTLQLASMRLAPVQLAAWGHPVTSGLPTIGYYLSAAAFEPPDGSRHYTEQLLRLPNLGTYYEPEEDTPTEARADAVGGGTGPVFLCAGTPFKYSPEQDALLVEIARRLGHCQFHFFSYQDGVLSKRLLDRLHSAFAAQGLDGASHLVLRPWASPAEFHAVLRSADLSLDTIGFSGFNTVMQALACNLPVVTCRGRYMRGRLGSGVLERLSLPELVADDPKHYVDIAVSLAENRPARAEVRDKLRERLPQAYRDQSAIDALEGFLLHVV